MEAVMIKLLWLGLVTLVLCFKPIMKAYECFNIWQSSHQMFLYFSHKRLLFNQSSKFKYNYVLDEENLMVMH